MRILLDMNLSPLWVDFLQQEGFEAVHWTRIGTGAEADHFVMQWARDNGFVVFTHDLDFSALLAWMPLQNQNTLSQGTRHLVVHFNEGFAA